MGNGLDEGVNLGPLVNKEELDKVVELVDDAVGKGAKILTGGKATGGKGFLYPATVLANVPDNAKMLNEEIFGAAPHCQPGPGRRSSAAPTNTEYGVGRESLYEGFEPRHARVRKARLRHDRAQPWSRL